MTKNAASTPTRSRASKKPKAVASGALIISRPKTRSISKQAGNERLAITPKDIFPAEVVTSAAGHPASAVFAMLFGVAGVAISVAATLALDSLRPAAREFGARLARRVAPDARSEQEAAQRLRKQIESSADAQRATLEGVRRLLDSIAPEVAEPLADLTADYLDRPVDGFFRGAARMLSDVTSEEFATLSELLRRVCTPTVLEGGDPTLMYWDRGSGEPGPNRLYYNGKTEIENPERPRHTTTWRILGMLEAQHDVHVLRVIQQLKLNRLADDPNDGGAIGVSGSRIVWISRSTLQRLAALIASPSRPA
jgi:hypothetical protein